MNDLPDYVITNRVHWDKWAHTWVEAAERHWKGDPEWGIWGLLEADLRLLPEDMTGMHAIELGCGTGYVSAWMMRRGATAVGIDNSLRQLETARRLADLHEADLELIHGNAESVPLASESFDFAISEYGAAIWADPFRWIPEAWRLLRPGGRLVFLGNHPLVMLTQDYATDEPASHELKYPYFGLHRIDWDDGEDRATEFNLPISGWLRLFSQVGFDVEEYLELQAPEPNAEVRYYVSGDWAHAFPAEQVWKLRKRHS